MNAAKRLSLLLVAAVGFLWPACASAALFEKPPSTDVAAAWLRLLFHGDTLPEGLAFNSSRLGSVVAAIHRALGVYSTGILVLAALLIFYNIVRIVAETAHTGIPFGRRVSQFWAPIRLVLAIGFLVPVGGGLNAGQYLVAWMADEGSALASSVWNVATQEMKSAFAGTVLPRGPDVAGFVATGFEMEFCRALYQRDYATADSAAAIRLAGPIIAIQKLPRTRFAEETWQYTNRLHAALPLCGAYRFATPQPDQSAEAVLPGSLDRASRDLAVFSRAEADALITETQALAQASLPVFSGQTVGAGVHDGLAAIIAAHQAALDDRLQTLMAGDPGAGDQALAESADAGWISAGGLVFDLARRQAMYGDLASHALPEMQAPALAQPSLVQPSVDDAAEADPALRILPEESLTLLESFYAQLEHEVHLAHVWLYDQQLADMPILMGNSFDLRDQLNAMGGSQSASSLFSHVLGDAALVYGVWENANGGAMLSIPAAGQNIVAALAEFGRRQTALGSYLFAVASPDTAPAGMLSYALLFGGVGLLFLASGFILIFLLPLLPFFRFFVGVLAWLLAVFEAIIAIPIVALAYLNLGGEGLGGGARRAYVLWLGVVVRPVLTLLGFIIGLVLFTFAMIFLGAVFQHLSAATPSTGGIFVAINVALTLFYTLLALIAANASFKGINLLPEQAMKWLNDLSLPDAAEITVGAAPSAAAGASAQLPGIAIIPTTLGAPRVTAIAHASSSSQSSSAAEARAARMRAALFPQYRDPEKPSAETGKEVIPLTGSEKISKPGETSRDQLAPQKPRADRNLQKPPTEKNTELPEKRPDEDVEPDEDQEPDPDKPDQT